MSFESFVRELCRPRSLPVVLAMASVELDEVAERLLDTGRPLEAQRLKRLSESLDRVRREEFR